MSTLSVETSRRGSSTEISSPISLSQRVTVPSVTDSPRAGRVTSVPEPPEDFLASAFGASSAGFSSDFSSAFGSSFSAESSAESLESSEDSAASASPITARTWPTSASSSSWTRISSRVPATGEGTSVSTLSVETSRRGSSTEISSPISLSQRVTVPSVTDSPRAGRVTSVPEPPEDFLASAFGASSAGFSSDFSSAFGSSFSAESSAESLESSELPEPEPSPMTTSGAPTSTSSSSWTRISSITPATGEGTSVSTLSVEISTMASSTATSSPTSLSQRVTVPSVTDSPSAGRFTVSDMFRFSF